MDFDLLNNILNNIPAINNIYFLTIIVMLVIFLSKLELSHDNIDEKVLISYLILITLRLLNLVSTIFVILLAFIFYFVFIEIIFMAKEERNFIMTRYFILDFLYKMVFKYSFLYFLLIIVISSNFFKKIFTDFFILTLHINNDMSFIIYIIIFLIAIKIINSVLSCRFNTYSLTEVKDKMNNIRNFKGYIHDKRLENFASMLIYYEDRSFFSRNNSYNVFSLGYIKYKFNLIVSNRKCAIYKVFIFGTILKYFISLVIFIFKVIKKFIIRIYYILKKILSIIKKKSKIKTIRTLIRGYSTIEMQLIRTVALKDGYECTLQRKIYEVIYSTIFFKSLFNNYNYYKYPNIDEFRYWILYIYILVAPTFINGKKYRDIYSLYHQDNILEITDEAFYIYVLGLANREITRERYKYCPLKISKKQYLLEYDNLFNNNKNFPDTNGVSLKLNLYDTIKKKRFFIKLTFDYNKTLGDLINYICENYGERNTAAVIMNLEELFFGSKLKNKSIELLSLSILDIGYDNYISLLKITFGELLSNCDIYNTIVNIDYNVGGGIGASVGEENGIKYKFNNNEKSIHAHLPHINCINGSENIRIDLLTQEVMDGKGFKSPVMTKRAIEYVKSHLDELLDIWENVVDKDNVYNKKIEKVMYIRSNHK